MNLLTNQDILTLTDFVCCVTSRDQVIQANKCVIYKEVGVFLYQDDKEVFFAKGSVCRAEWINSGDEILHFYIRFEGQRGEHLYLKQKQDYLTHQKRPIVSKDDWVFLSSEEDIVSKLIYLEFSHPGKLDELKDTIIKEFAWKVIEIVNHRMVCVQKEDRIKYVVLEDVSTFKEVKKSATEWTKLKNKNS